VTDDLAVRVRVLVLEDDPMLARTIARGLASDGNEIELSDAPRSVLARVEAGEDAWDVVLLDVGLPDMSGIDVLRRFRELNSPASVVMLTGDTTAVTATKCMRDGAFYYLTKPFDHIAARSPACPARSTTPPTRCWSAPRRRCAGCARRSIGWPGRMSRS
jgi:DNA-binding response OmpR family regulator